MKGNPMASKKYDWEQGCSQNALNIIQFGLQNQIIQKQERKACLAPREVKRGSSQGPKHYESDLPGY